MPTAKQRRLQLRELMKLPGLTVAPSCFNALSGCLIEQTGYKAIHVSGSSVARSHAYADLGLLGMAEMVAIHERIVEATGLPVVGDAECAFGAPIHAARTVRSYERAGLAAIHIEDEIFPKGQGDSAHQVLPKNTMVGKLKAALDARSDETFLVIARCNARESETFNQVMDRLAAYAETGVDAIWPGVRLPEELGRLRRLVSLPMVGVPPRQQMSLSAYGEFGFKIGCVPGILGQAATAAMAELLQIFKETGSDEDYWKPRPGADRWRQWFSNLGKEEQEAMARLIPGRSSKS